MAHNGHRQQWQQPPPQRQYQYDDRNDPRAWQGNVPSQRMPNQRPQQHNNHQPPNSGYHNGYNDYGAQPYDQQAQWQGQQYQDPYQYPQQHNGQYQEPHAQGPPPNRTYQYDDRYRNHGQAPPQNMNGQMHGNGHKPRDKPRPGPLAEQKRPKPRERILTEPESPKTLAWDNPFGTFPPKKKDQKHQKHASLDGANGNMSLGVDPAVNSDQRPHTSQGHHKPDTSRPSTSHVHRPSPPPDSRIPIDSEMPLRKPLPGPIRNPGSLSQPGQIGLPSRPAPIRSVTQPSPQIDNPQFQEYGSVDPYGYEQKKENETSYAQASAQRMKPPLLDKRRPSDQTHNRPPRRESFDQDAYRGLPLHKPRSNQSQGNAEIPNFKAMSPHIDETTFEAVSPAQEQPAYAKKPYQALGQVDTQRARPPPPEASRASPLADFSFDLPQSSGPHLVPTTSQQSAYSVASPVRYDNPPLSAAPARYDNPLPAAASLRYDNPPPAAASLRYDNPPQSAAPLRYDNPPMSPPPANDYSNQRGYDPRLQAQPPRTASRQQGPTSQFPPRGASQTEKEPLFERGDQGPNDSGYWQASPEQMQARPHTSGNNQPREPQGYRQESREDYGQGFDQRYGNDHGPTRPQYQRDPYSDPGNPFQQGQPHGQGHQAPSPPRAVAQPQGNFAPGQGRPQTANAAHPLPVRSYGDRPAPETVRPDMPPANGGVGDRPVPIRPGLVNVVNQSPAPRVQAPVAPRATTAPPPEANTGPASVTVAELNNMRENFKNHPNDHELGLRFAKRLVEAAQVLSTESGRADPKQTAKNRERYIFDATKVVKKLVSSGYPEAMFYLADCYGQGLLGLPVDAKEAFSLYQSAAKLHHPQSAYRVAVCCELGNEEGGGTRRDPLKAVQWYKRAATLGDTPAMYKMGMILLKGLLSQPRDPRQAVSWLKRAAERADKDNPHALHELGLLYESATPTDHIIRDEKYSFQLFNQAAELGYKYSQFRLGSAFEYGLLGCQIDPRQSIAWYTRAAAQGEHQSELALSGWYLTGSEPLLQQSDQEAYLWARKAAQSGLAKAEYAMGYFTETGIGTRADLEEAKRWYYRAAAQNMTKARERLEELKRGAKMQQKTRVSRSHMSKGKDDCVVM